MDKIESFQSQAQKLYYNSLTGLTEINHETIPHIAKYLTTAEEEIVTRKELIYYVATKLRKAKAKLTNYQIEQIIREPLAYKIMGLEENFTTVAQEILTEISKNMTVTTANYALLYNIVSYLGNEYNKQNLALSKSKKALFEANKKIAMLESKIQDLEIGSKEPVQNFWDFKMIKIEEEEQETESED